VAGMRVEEDDDACCWPFGSRKFMAFLTEFLVSCNLLKMSIGNTKFVKKEK
jgi:hypothetical protein